jgi:hypothetical protein
MKLKSVFVGFGGLVFFLVMPRLVYANIMPWGMDYEPTTWDIVRLIFSYAFFTLFQFGVVNGLIESGVARLYFRSFAMRGKILKFVFLVNVFTGYLTYLVTGYIDLLMVRQMTEVGLDNRFLGYPRVLLFAEVVPFVGEFVLYKVIFRRNLEAGAVSDGFLAGFVIVANLVSFGFGALVYSFMG